MYVSSPLIKYAVAGYPVDISMWGFIDGLFHNTICDVYWFFYAILMLYLVTPIFSLIVDNKRLLQYAIIVCIISTMIIPLLNRFMPTDDFFSLLAAPYLKGWITYYLLGYYLQPVSYTHLQQTKRSSGSNNGTQSSTLLDRLIKCNCLLCRRCTPLFDEYLHECW